jgi:hypothetical protein
MRHVAIYALLSCGLLVPWVELVGRCSKCRANDDGSKCGRTRAGTLASRARSRAPHRPDADSRKCKSGYPPQNGPAKGDLSSPGRATSISL